MSDAPAGVRACMYVKLCLIINYCAPIIIIMISVTSGDRQNQA